jgi:hypothetical protein
MGFQPRDIADTMDLRNYTRKARESIVTERVNSIVSLLTTHYPADGHLTQADLDYAGTQVEMLLLDIEDPSLASEIHKQVSEKMMSDPKTLSLINETFKYLYESEGQLEYGSAVDQANVALNPLLLPENIQNQR